MLYTLAFRSVHTRLVFRSSIRKPSRTSAVGRSARDERALESCQENVLASASKLKGRVGSLGHALFRFDRRSAYSSSTSCSSGLHAGAELEEGGGSAIFGVDDIRDRNAIASVEPSVDDYK